MLLRAPFPFKRDACHRYENNQVSEASLLVVEAKIWLEAPEGQSFGCGFRVLGPRTHAGRSTFNLTTNACTLCISFCNAVPLSLQFYPLFLSKFQVNVYLSSDIVSYKTESVQVRFGLRHNGTVRAILSTNTEPVPMSASVSLLFDAIHLSRDERLLFATRKGELLFQSIQQKSFPVFSGDTTVQCLLDFTGTANHFIVTMNYKKINSFRLLINGIMVNADTDANMYRYFNNSLAIKGYIYVIPFALDCNNPQPSGSITFYGRKNTVLIVNMDPDTSGEIQIVGVMLDSMKFENGLVF